MYSKRMIFILFGEHAFNSLTLFSTVVPFISKKKKYAAQKDEIYLGYITCIQ